MRSFRRDKKGQVRVIEAFFAAVLMLSSLTLIPVVQKGGNSASGGLSAAAFGTLTSLDNDGQLARLVDQRNWTAVKGCLESVVPAALWFNLTVFDENMAPLNSVLISNGGAPGSNLDAADYIAVSPSGNYAIYTLRLQLAGLN